MGSTGAALQVGKIELDLKGCLRPRLTLPRPLVFVAPDSGCPFLHRAEARAVWRNFLAGRTGWARPWGLYVVSNWVHRYLCCCV
jgi:hypothetical protein